MLISEALRTGTGEARLVRIQLVICILLSFYTSLRPSSIGHNTVYEVNQKLVRPINIDDTSSYVCFLTCDCILVSSH